MIMEYLFEAGTKAVVERSTLADNIIIESGEHHVTRFR